MGGQNLGKTNRCDQLVNRFPRPATATAHSMRWLKRVSAPVICRTTVPAHVPRSKQSTETLPGEVNTLGLVRKGVQILQHSLDGKCRGPRSTNWQTPG
jgi:hypothetical protein